MAPSDLSVVSKVFSNLKPIPAKFVWHESCPSILHLKGDCMKYGSTILGLVFMMVALVNAYQSGAFSWQATQGTAMTGQSNIIREKVIVTIQPDHLDVKHELEMNTLSSWGTHEFPNALEIVGNIVVEKGTAKI